MIIEFFQINFDSLERHTTSWRGKSKAKLIRNAMIDSSSSEHNLSRYSYANSSGKTDEWDMFLDLWTDPIASRQSRLPSASFGHLNPFDSKLDEINSNCCFRVQLYSRHF